MPNTVPPMIVTRFKALYAKSRKRGLRAFSTLPDSARDKVRPALYICSQNNYHIFAPVTTQASSMGRMHIHIDRRHVQSLDFESYVDKEELWYIPKPVIYCFTKCFRYSVDEAYIRSSIYPHYADVINNITINQ